MSQLPHHNQHTHTEKLNNAEGQLFGPREHIWKLNRETKIGSCSSKCVVLLSKWGFLYIHSTHSTTCNAKGLPWWAHKRWPPHASQWFGPRPAHCFSLQMWTWRTCEFLFFPTTTRVEPGCYGSVSALFLHCSSHNGRLWRQEVFLHINLLNLQPVFKWFAIHYYF